MLVELQVKQGGDVSLPPLVEPAESLTPDEIRRYSRHLIIPDVAMDGQKRLKNAKVLCVGAGGLGSPALMYLAAAGVELVTDVKPFELMKLRLLNASHSALAYLGVLFLRR